MNFLNKKKKNSLRNSLLKDIEKIYANSSDKRDFIIEEKCEKLYSDLKNANISFSQLKKIEEILDLAKQFLNGNSTVIFKALTEVESIMIDKKYEIDDNLVNIFKNEITISKNRDDIIYWEKTYEDFNEQEKIALEQGDESGYYAIRNKKVTVINKLKMLRNREAKISKKSASIESAIDITHTASITEELDKQKVDLEKIEAKLSKVKKIDEQIFEDSNELNQMVDENILDLNSLEGVSFEKARAEYLMSKKEEIDNIEKENTMVEKEENSQ